MFDIFYTGPKPNLFVFEKPAESFDAAVTASRTEFFWFVDGNNDYTNFDFTWMPPPWDYEYTHTFPSQWQQAGGVYFARKNSADKTKLKFQGNQSVHRKVDMSKWIVPENIDISGFDFSWHPNPLEPQYEYHFGTHWQKDGGPIYKGTAGIKYIATQKVYTTATQIFYMDFMNPGSQQQFELLRKRYPAIKSTRYVNDHLNVLKRIINLAESKFVWVVSSICDYTNFDFTWHPEHYQEEMIHCFPSDNQKRGDTFYINVNSFKTQMYNLELLDWFNVINYCQDQKVSRIPMPVITYSSDNLVEQIQQYEFKEPYAIFTNQETIRPFYQPCLWTEKDRSVTTFTRSNSICTVPRDVKAYLQRQVYDYPHINDEKTQKYSEQELDIIYISNGEPDEKKYFEWTEYQSNRDVKWIRGINGRTKAYCAAAEASSTPWFFAVFAKLEVLGGSFPWDWQPDYFQEPKHYIFNAKNCLNGLEYGHMAMIAYNKKLVLDTANAGIDFTLSQPHQSVPILSGNAIFNQDPWTTWRTAFREVVKLCHFNSCSPTVENTHRLKVWSTRAEGAYAEWCLLGAQDAIKYYELVNGDYDKLCLTYEWDWLRTYYSTKY